MPSHWEESYQRHKEHLWAPVKEWYKTIVGKITVSHKKSQKTLSSVTHFHFKSWWKFTEYRFVWSLVRVEPWFAKPQNNKVLSIMNDFPGPVIVEYMEKNFDTMA